MTKTAVEYIQGFQDACTTPAVRSLVDSVCLDAAFIKCSGAGSDKHHHYGTGGLLTHCGEVFDIMNTVNQTLCLGVDYEEIVLAAVYHDIGKLHCYEEVSGVWQKSTFGKSNGHIAMSLAGWSHAVRTYPISDDLYTAVWHMIGSHHGTIEWGCVHTPKTKGAWLLHTADLMSARLNDLGGGKHV